MTQQNQWLFVSDVNDTLLGDEIALGQLAQTLQNRPNLIIAFNSSRSCASLRQTLATHALPIPDYLIGALGTEIQTGTSGEPVGWYSRLLYRACLDHGRPVWNRNRIAALMDALGLTAHTPEYQTPFKVSYDVPNPARLIQIFDRLAAAGQEAKVIYSSGKNLDIIPYVAGKGSAIACLGHRLGISPEQVVVAGYSGNDLEMFVAPYKGIVVANATPELKRRQGAHIYHTQATHAAGVLEGLYFWGVI
ncbi:MAG TPA: HAD family hydrolase [Anaerolineae bacterium]|nr:HAD family hydrolase [Anaerolineae bacterium]